MQWLLDLIVPHLGSILAGLTAAVAGVLVLLQGKKIERQKGQIVTQQEIIDAHKTRTNVEDAIRRGGDDERDRQRMRYIRDE